MKTGGKGKAAVAYDSPEAIKCLLQIKYPPEVILHKFDGGSLFEFAFDNYHSRPENFEWLRLLFSDVSRCDLFFTQIAGYQSNLSQDLKSKAYKRWALSGKNRSFLQLACSVEPASMDRISWAIEILKRYDGLLKTELGLVIRTHTVLTRLLTGSLLDTKAQSNAKSPFNHNNNRFKGVAPGMITRYGGLIWGEGSALIFFNIFSE